MKIYAITSGTICASSYKICALTTKKERAIKLKYMFQQWYCKVQIEEYEDVEDIYENQLWECDGNGGNPIFLKTGGANKIIDNKGEIYAVYVLAKDSDRAEKKAQDMIAEYKYRKQVEGKK